MAEVKLNDKTKQKLLHCLCGYKSSRHKAANIHGKQSVEPCRKHHY